MGKYYYIVKGTTLAAKANNKKQARTLLNEWYCLSVHERDVVRIDRKELVNRLLEQF